MIDIVMSGTFTQEFTEKMVELNGNQVPYMLAVLASEDSRFPITVWGDKKIGYVKTAISTQMPVKIVVQLSTKVQTYTNHEGETVQVPNVQLKLYSFLTIPKTVEQTKYPIESVAADPAQSFYFAPPPQKKKDIEDTDPTGSFRCFSEEEKKQLEKPFSPSWINQKVKPWPKDNGVEQHETWGTVF